MCKLSGSEINELNAIVSEFINVASALGLDIDDIVNPTLNLDLDIYNYYKINEIAKSRRFVELLTKDERQNALELIQEPDSQA